MLGYSDEVSVVKYVATMMPILAVSNFLDGLQCVMSGCYSSILFCEVGIILKYSHLIFICIIDRHGKRMWMAENWSFCQSGVILCSWDSISYLICFCLALWWQGEVLFLCHIIILTLVILLILLP